MRVNAKLLALIGATQADVDAGRVTVPIMGGNGAMDFVDTITGKAGADAAGQAAGYQALATKKAMRALRRSYGQGLNFLTGAYDENMALIGDEFEASPGFDFALNEGLDAVQNRVATTRSPYGTAAQKGMARYATGLAQQDYGNWLSRRLGFASNMGNSIAGMYGAEGGAMADLWGQYGNAAAGGAVGAANARAQGVNSLLGAGTTLGAAWLLSDARLKREVVPLDGAASLALVLRLRPVAWEWAETLAAAQVREGEHGTGVVAQEVAEIAPELVHEGPDGYLRVDYGALCGHLIAAVQAMADGIRPMSAAELEGVRLASTRRREAHLSRRDHAAGGLAPATVG